jgi:hypothetical protein
MAMDKEQVVMAKRKPNMFLFTSEVSIAHDFQK